MIKVRHSGQASGVEGKQRGHQGSYGRNTQLESDQSVIGCSRLGTLVRPAIYRAGKGVTCAAMAGIPTWKGTIGAALFYFRVICN